MPDFVDALKTNTAALTWNEARGYNAQVKIGDTSRNIKLPVGHSGLTEQDEAIEDVLNILNPRTMGLITSRSRITHRNADHDVPADITGRHMTETFLFRELRGGVETYVRVSVPFYVGNAATGTADKATVGAQIAAALSGNLASYQFVS